MKAKIRDTEIYFDVDGAQLLADGARLVERPVTLVLHGGPGVDHSGYKPVLSPLTAHTQLVYVDHRGQGRSQRGAKETHTLSNNVEDLEALREYLGLEKINVLGASYGGMVAMSYAVAYPDRVSDLIALVTAPDCRFIRRAKEILKVRGSKEQRRAAKALWAGAFESEEQLQDYFYTLGPLYSLKFDAVKAQLNRSRAILSVDAINMGFSDFLRTYDITDKLKNITARTLVIGARHDWICAPEFSELIAREIPGADLHIIGNSGHSVLADQGDLVLELISNFFSH
jgi:proline iminopeptidase